MNKKADFSAGVPTAILSVMPASPGNLWLPGRVWSECVPLTIDLSAVANNTSAWGSQDVTIPTQHAPVNFVMFGASGRNNAVHVSIDRPTIFQPQVAGFAPYGQFVCPASFPTQTFLFPAMRGIVIFVNINPAVFAVLDTVWLRYGYLPQATDRAVDDIAATGIGEGAFEDPDEYLP